LIFLIAEVADLKSHFRPILAPSHEPVQVFFTCTATIVEYLFFASEAEAVLIFLLALGLPL
jgi:hypothetical protein